MRTISIIEPKPKPVAGGSPISTISATDDGITEIRVRTRPVIQSGISVILAVKNQSKFLPEMLDSIFSQVLAPDEVIVVNDSSTEPVREIVEKYPDVTRYIEVDYSNAAQARMAGFACSNRELLLFCDGDNRFPRDYIKRLKDSMFAGPFDVTYGRIRKIGDGYGYFYQPRIFDVGALSCRNFVESCSLVRREIFERVGGWDPEVDTLMDWNLWMRIAHAGGKFAFCADAEFEYRVHDEQMTVHKLGLQRQIKAQKQTLNTTLFTAFCGRLWQVERYFNWLSSIPHKEKLNVIFYDNSGDCYVKQLITDWLQTSEFKSWTYHNDPIPACKETSPGEFASGDTAIRLQRVDAIHRKMVDIYNWAAQNVTTDLLWIVEDDIIPPTDALDKLMDALRPDVGAVCAAVHSRFHDGLIAWLRGYWVSGDPPINLETQAAVLKTLPDEFFPVGQVGGCCTLLRTHAFKRVALRCYTLPDRGGIGWDSAMCHDLARLGFKIMLHTGVQCQHWNKDAAGEETYV